MSSLQSTHRLACGGYLNYPFNQKKKKKVQLFLSKARRAYRESTGMAPLILNFAIRWRWAVNFKSGRFTPRKEPGTHWAEGCVGPKASLEVSRREKYLSPTGIRRADRPTHSAVVIPTTLFQVLSTEYNVAKCQNDVCVMIGNKRLYKAQEYVSTKIDVLGGKTFSRSCLLHWRLRPSCLFACTK